MRISKSHGSVSWLLTELPIKLLRDFAKESQQGADILLHDLSLRTAH